jgi:hypothetical protein
MMKKADIIVDYLTMVIPKKVAKQPLSTIDKAVEKVATAPQMPNADLRSLEELSGRVSVKIADSQRMEALRSNYPAEKAKIIEANHDITNYLINNKGEL